jgi:hypothetical protein
MRQSIENVERPLALLIMAVVLAALIFFGIRYYTAVRARARRETAYQTGLRSYNQTLKAGMKRKEVEDYLRSNKIEFLRLGLDDLTEIGEDEAPNWFCGKPTVYVKFQFKALQQQERAPDPNEGHTLDEIHIVHMASGCL